MGPNEGEIRAIVAEDEAVETREPDRAAEVESARRRKNLLFSQIMGTRNQDLVNAVYRVAAEMSEGLDQKINPFSLAEQIGIDLNAVSQERQAVFDFRAFTPEQRQEYLESFKEHDSGGCLIDFRGDSAAEKAIGLMDLFSQPELILTPGPRNRRHPAHEPLKLTRETDGYYIRGTRQKAYVWSGDRVAEAPRETMTVRRINKEEAKEMLRRPPDSQAAMDEQGRLIVYEVEGARLPQKHELEGKKQFIALHGTGARPEWNDSLADLAGFIKLHQKADAAYLVTKQGLVFRFFNDALGYGATGQLSQENIDPHFTKRGIAIEASARQVRNDAGVVTGVEPLTAEQKRSIALLIEDTARRNDIPREHWITSADPVRNLVSGEFLYGAHQDDFSDEDRAAVGMPSATEARESLIAWRAEAASASPPPAAVEADRDSEVVDERPPEESARSWLISLLAHSPNFRFAHREEIRERGKREVIDGYADDLLASVRQAGIPLTPQNIAFLLSIQEVESAFRSNPPKKGDVIAEGLDSEYGGLVDKILRIASPQIARAIALWQDKLKACQNEYDLYRWGQGLARSLESGPLSRLIKNDSTFRAALWMAETALPNTTDLIQETIAKLKSKPATLGTYQVNVDILMRTANAYPEELGANPDWKRLAQNRDLLVRSMLQDPRDHDLIPKTVTEAFVLRYHVKTLMEANDVNRNGSVDAEECLYAAADFHAGLYASRNAAVQHALNQVFSQNLTVDGDLSFYDEQGRPAPQKGVSSTMKALRAYATTLTPGQRKGKSADALVKDFVALGKNSQLEEHPLWQLLIVNPGRPTHVLPSGASNASEEAQLSGHKVSDAGRYGRRAVERYQGYLASLPPSGVASASFGTPKRKTG